MILQSSIQEVQNRADIIEILGQFIRLKKRGANYIANCPFHNEKTPSFYVSAPKGIYKCFGCGKGGNVVTFIQDHEKLTYPEAIRWLADYYKIELKETERSPEQAQQQQTEESLRILNEFAAKFFESQLVSEEGIAIGMSYFRQRGFSAQTIDKFRLGYSPESWDSFYKEATAKQYSTELMEKSGLIKSRNGTYYDTYRGRVVFPIQSMTGRILGFGARILKSNDKAPKYINSPENELYIKSKVLYGMYQSRQSISKLDECILVEGYTDVISLHQGGVENVVASSGTSLTEDQLRLIAQLTKNLIILYDGDNAGIKAALRGLDMALSQSFNVHLVLLPDGEDPDSFVQKGGEKVFREYIKNNKKDIIGFRLEIGLKEIGDDPVKKSKLVNEIAESISKINRAEDFSLQEYFMREASRKLDVDEAGLITLVNKFIRERLDQEKRRRQNDERDTPDGPSDYSTTDPVIESHIATQKPKEELQEWELVRVLLEYGFLPMAEGQQIFEYIIEHADPDLIESAKARQIFNEYYDYTNTHGTPPEISIFVNHTEEDIRERMASLLHTRNEISHNWKAKFGIETLHGSDGYKNETESAVLYFELKKLKTVQAELLERQKTEQNPDKMMKLITKQLELKQMEAEIVKKTGTVIWKNK